MISSTKLTDFRRHVYALCRHVPAGSVISYSSLASAVQHLRPNSSSSSSPSSAELMVDYSSGPASVGNTSRAVGSALSVNPFAPFVPCHRVVKADGSLGGFTGSIDHEGEEIRLKIRLLESEGLLIGRNEKNHYQVIGRKSGQSTGLKGHSLFFQFPDGYRINRSELEEKSLAKRSLDDLPEASIELSQQAKERRTKEKKEKETAIINRISSSSSASKRSITDLDEDSVFIIDDPTPPTSSASPSESSSPKKKLRPLPVDPSSSSSSSFSSSSSLPVRSLTQRQLSFGPSMDVGGKDSSNNGKEIIEIE